MKHLPKVFVVDDDSAVLASIEAVLTAQGYGVKCFTSAEAFLAQHHPTEVGCILVELLMPGMSGVELLRRLQEAGSLLSIVVVTGFLDPAVAGKLTKAPVALLEKPYEISTLLKMVEDGIAASMKRRADRLRGKRPD